MPAVPSEIHGNAGSTVRLECPILPGVVVEQYYVRWHRASDRNGVLYESFPPHLSFPPINVDAQRYSVDAEDLSLSIHDVTPADGADEYVCVLGVEDPLDRTRPLIYTQTENANLSLAIHVSDIQGPIDCMYDQKISPGYLPCDMIAF